MAETQRKKVLLADDDLAILLTLKNYIVKAGFDIETVTNGQDAVNKTKEWVPDLIIMDAVMPQMSGFQACREIRALNPGKKIPIIMLTGLKADTDAMNARAAGATEFIKKPIKGEDLVRRIQGYLR